MKGMVQKAYGSPDKVLYLEDVAKPAINDDEVLLRIGAAGVNWADWSAVRGMPYLMRVMYGLRKPRDEVGGLDVAGTVVETGAKVTTFLPGDEVFGQGQGAFAEYGTAKAKNLAPKPR